MSHASYYKDFLQRSFHLCVLSTTILLPFLLWHQHETPYFYHPLLLWWSCHEDERSLPPIPTMVKLAWRWKIFTIHSYYCIIVCITSEQKKCFTLLLKSKCLIIGELYDYVNCTHCLKQNASYGWQILSLTK